MKRPSNIKQRQTGMTMYGTMFVLIIIGFVATAAIKVGPSYIDNHVVTSALNDVHKSYMGVDLQDVSDNAIKAKIQGYFDVNMVNDVISKSVKITREKQKVILSVNYEIRNNFMGNVDIVLVFNNEVDLAQ